MPLNILKKQTKETKLNKTKTNTRQTKIYLGHISLCFTLIYLARRIFIASDRVFHYSEQTL